MKLQMLGALVQALRAFLHSTREQELELNALHVPHKDRGNSKEPGLRWSREVRKKGLDRPDPVP